MSVEKGRQWLADIKGSFVGGASGADDFYFLLETMVKEARLKFSDLLSNAAQGKGCVIHEGLMYSLDQDWDDPDAFDEVTFFVGDLESSTLPIDRYLSLLRLASLKYSEYFPDSRDRVLSSLSAVEERYSHRPYGAVSSL